MTGGAIVVLDGGVQATVQDLGRPGWTALGVAHSGAADALSLRIGNRLVGNDDGAAGLELTLVGGALRCTRDAVVALTGAPLEARIERTGARLPRYAAVTIAAGDVLRIGGTAHGVRGYLCVRGGIAVPEVLASRSTQVNAGLGGHAGRPLRAGDELPVGTAARGAPPRALSAEAAARASTRSCDSRCCA